MTQHPQRGRTARSAPSGSGSALYTVSEVQRACKERWGDRPHDAKYEAWVEQRIGALRGEGLIITEQQSRDAHAQRELARGDAVRYVGPKRTESGDVSYTRPAGQLGFISEVTPQGAVTFEPEDENAPALIVQLGTVSYWLLERTPERAPPPIYAIERGTTRARGATG